MTAFVGVDPGLTGCVALLHGQHVEFFDTPTLTITTNKKVKTQMDPAACSLLLAGLSQRYPDILVTIEKVAPMPSFKGAPGVDGEVKPQAMGVTSAFNFGMGYGMWIGICAALLLPYQLVHPATWKRGMDKGKDSGRRRAMQLYPHTAKSLSRKMDHGRADALLLARYGSLNMPDAQFDRPAAPAQPELF